MILYTSSQETALQNAPVAQLDRVFGYEPKGRGFESLPAYQNTSVRTTVYIAKAIFILVFPTDIYGYQ